MLAIAANKGNLPDETKLGSELMLTFVVALAVTMFAWAVALGIWYRFVRSDGYWRRPRRRPHRKNR